MVAPILEAVRKRGDEAVLEYARKFDGSGGQQLRACRLRMAAPKPRVSPEFRAALETAAKNIREYAELQLPRETWVRFPDGRRLGQIVRPLESMGAYIPGRPLSAALHAADDGDSRAGRGRAAPSAWRRRIPARDSGSRDDFSASAHVFRIGGAQAIAALAFGTATVPKVDRIVGPGNIYVAAAKKAAGGRSGHRFRRRSHRDRDHRRGCRSAHIAADMLAQAEHDVEASAILLTTSRTLAEQVALEVARQLETLPTAPVACEAIRNQQRRDSVSVDRCSGGSVQSACAGASGDLR